MKIPEARRHIGKKQAARREREIREDYAQKVYSQRYGYLSGYQKPAETEPEQVDASFRAPAASHEDNVILGVSLAAFAVAVVVFVLMQVGVL